MEYTLTSRTIGTLCRVCLTSTKNLVHLSTPLNEKILNRMEEQPIHTILERVTFDKIVLNEKKYPSKICQMCLSLLKIAHEFQLQFQKSQNLLGTSTKNTLVEDEQILLAKKYADKSVMTQSAIQSSSVPVELIYGSNRFDLNDVLVVEEDKKDEFSFDGFLRNLGSEVSVKFVCDDDPPSEHLKHTEDSDFNTAFNGTNSEKVITNDKIRTESLKVSPQIDYDSLDFSQLTVKKYPDECKIVVEQIGEINKIIKTLFECPYCRKIVLSKTELEAHKELEHQNYNLRVCDKCGHIATTKSQLYHHMQKHKGKRFKCQQCNKKYDTISRLKVHQEIHKNERRYLCNVCGKSFNYSISLTYHLRLHADKTLVCNICGLKFRMANTLKRHLRTHTKDKPYSCDYCPKRFSSRGEKLCHEMLHTGVKPYRCEYCGKRFTKSGNLQSHYLSHSGPHQCLFCSKTFLEMKFLRLHGKRAHKDFQIIEVVEN